ncbi:MAG: hypothetical protein E7047_01055 [Lentisphaerae bacterium]|nr:hypothetical protein [Lentisphaerota bacterium]
MDIKYTLQSILREAASLGANGQLLAGIRLAGAVNGERGEGYLMLYSEGLVLLYRRLGLRDYEGIFASLDEWSFDKFREEKYLLTLEVRCRSNTFRCEFTPSERDSAEQILNAIAAAHAEPLAVYSESTLLMAGLLIGMSGPANGDLSGLLDKKLYLAACKYATKHQLAEMIVRAGEIFSEDQKKSLLLNLIEFNLYETELPEKSCTLLRELAKDWLLDENFFETSTYLLSMRSKLNTLFSGTE